MNLKELKDMINLMNENDLTELEVEKEGLKIKLKRSPGYDTELLPIKPPMYRVENLPAASKQAETASQSASTQKTVEIASPMVGTFYRAPSPESAPFVEIGQTVEIGQVVCIIEAMKLMNEIKSEVKGKVVAVSVDNAEPVEFGQSLFTVEPV